MCASYRAVAVLNGELANAMYIMVCVFMLLSDERALKPLLNMSM